MKKQKFNDRISELVKSVNKTYPHRKRIRGEDSRKEILKRNINNTMSRNIWASLKKQYWWNWEKFVGYSLNDLIKHLKKTMPKGYTWQDFLDSKLHIDHIIPVKAFIFNKPESKEFKECWALENLRLLPAKDNESKGDKITNPTLLGLLINQK